MATDLLIAAEDRAALDSFLTAHPGYMAFVLWGEPGDTTLVVRCAVGADVLRKALAAVGIEIVAEYGS